MTLENNLERLIQDSFLNYFINQELTDLTAKFIELHKQGYQFGFIESISGDIEQWDIKNVSQPIKWFNQSELDVAAIITNEKLAAISLQHFEYAARMREFEIYLQEEMFNLNNPALLLKIIKTRMDYCVISKGKTIYLYLNSRLRQFSNKIKNMVNSVNTNVIAPNYSKTIKEIIFKIEENETLTELVRNEYGQYWQTEQENHYAYLVYVDDVKPIVLHVRTSESEETICKPQISFLEHLSNINISDFKQLTILVTHFRDLKTPLKSYIGHTIPAIESLLADSGGWIVYPHHLESLFRMTTGRSCKEAIAFRNNINKKNINNYELFFDTPICGTSIGKLLQERMLTEFVLYPDYHTANLLFDYLN